MTHREELAWAAGLFDGEGFVGCLNTGKGNKYRHLRLTVGQSDTEVLVRFYDAIGFGNLNGPITPKRGQLGKKDMWALNIHGFEQVQAAVAMLWPWLSTPKRQQAKRALLEARAYYATVRKHVRKQ